ncbi:methylated-DNA--[protein]-cysteine S-methyltransferase [Sinobaca sp. H24]|uniref:methylated-DNA--[protein]-cysteine S-methyltransferase n=1 Tax=Sinobaca sp. H24 TaxID=2923376 RepID=UPI00207A63A7|nr:methylated-DNA--[protein]-cysteine S-methyltransferase [Sinobaca sp. H24]
MKDMLYYTEVTSPIGPLTLFSSHKGLMAVKFANAEEAVPLFNIWALKVRGADFELEESASALKEAMKQLNEYFNGERKDFSITYDLEGTPFQKAVWEALIDVPYGKTASYKEIAASAGSEKAVRAVGNANNKNPIPIMIPCHRIIGSNGALVGYGGGMNKKIYLLEMEKEQMKLQLETK